MSLLNDFKNREDKRISELFEIIERFTDTELNYIFEMTLELYTGDDFIKEQIKSVFKKKVFKVLKIKNDRPITDSDFMEVIIKTDCGIKKCLLVTICNDICKLGMLNEATIYTQLRSFISASPLDNSTD